jgi:RNA-directed DNA polymerase
VYIPKPGSRKRRPLGIPVILDRCHQARVVNALEPEWEARFEPRSYGFRPGRGCHDAIQADYLWRLTYKWARFSHQNKPKSWVVHRYFDKFNKSRQDRWVFGDRQSGAYMHKFSWTRILRHRIVKHGASPDDPAFGGYWAWRRRKVPLPINKTQELTDAQDGRCLICGGLLFAVEDRPQNPREWQRWLATTHTTINTIAGSKEAEPRLVHAGCRIGAGLALHNAYEPSGLA